MIFKRLLITGISIFLGLALGVWCTPFCIIRFGLPNSIGSYILISSICTLILATSTFFITGRLFNDMEKMAEAEKRQLQRRWAWLKPAGIALRSPFPINKNQVIIGRDIKCDVLLLNDSISRRHAEIVREGSGWRIRDLGSSNGTFINGQRKSESLLNEGDLITLGDINMTFEGPAEPMMGDISEEGFAFPSEQEAISNFGESGTQVYRYNNNGEITGVVSSPTGSHTEVMTSGTRVS